MDPNPSNSAIDLFDHVVELPADQRRLFLDSHCGDPDTRGEVESLLSSYDDAGTFLSERPEDDVEPYRVGVRIGHYELLELIGEGGFARVFRAKQSRPVRREVALKLIKLGMDTRAVIARFEVERQTLAMMDHPHIAAVYDAGATETGRPFFVMELVRGKRITHYCDENTLDVRQRVKLFADVCLAVQHAHSKGVLHRDLKPSNLLVTTVDGKPVPKVIDFGIAKALQPRPVEMTVTHSQQLLGTPQYMSPEQALSGGSDVDTRSDVYSLGAVLYELLAGVPPLETQSPSSSALEQLQRLTSDQEMRRASARARPEHRRELRGELDWIVGKCLEKDRSRRYDTAAALAADLQAYLNRRPITAAPPSVSYRARKFVRRNAVAVAAAGLVFVALLVGTIVSTMLAVRATRAERLAQKRLYEAESANANLRAVNNFLTNDMIGAAEPGVTRGRALTVREALDNAAGAIPGKFPDRPAIEAAVRDSVAMAYLMLGHADLALPHAMRALEQREAALGPEHPDTIVAINDLAIVLRSLGRLAEAEAFYKRALDSCRRTLPADHDHTLSVLNNYSDLLGTLGRSAESEAMVKEVWQQSRRVRGEDHEKTILALKNYAGMVVSDGRGVEAEPLAREALERSQATRGDDHPLTLSCLHNYAHALDVVGRHVESERLYEQVLQRRRRVLGADHPETISSLSGYASTLNSLGRFAQAEPLHKEVLERRRGLLGEDHPSTIEALHDYATVLQSLGRPGDAEPLQREALERRRRVLGDDHPDTLSSMNSYAYDLRVLGRSAEAEPLLREVLEKRRRIQGEDHPGTLVALNNYASFLQFVRRYDEAEPLHREALERRRRVLGEDNRYTLSSLNNYANVLRSLGRAGEAEPYAREAWQKYRQALGEDHPDTMLVLNNYAATITAQGRHADAEPLYAKLYETAGQSQLPAARAAIYMAEYGLCLTRLGRYADAEEPLLEARRRLRATNQGASAKMRDVLTSLTSLSEQFNRPEEAVKWRAELEAMTDVPSTRPATAPGD